MSKMAKHQKSIELMLEEALISEEELPHETPSNWVYFKFTSILDVQGGTQPPKSQFIDEEQDGYVRLIQIRDFASDKYKTFIPDTSKLRKIEEEDVLIARYGASIGRILTGLSGAYNVALAKVVFPKRKIHPIFLFWLLKSQHFQAPLLSISRSAQSGFNKKDLSYFKMPLPPYNEQKRIGDKVERLLNKIDVAKQLIDEAKETFELRRAAILDKAFRGELTAKWRLERKELKSAIDLLATIKKEKENIYALECRDAVQKGEKKPLKPKTFGIDFEKKELPNLPKSWSYCSLGEVIYNFKYGTSSKSEYKYEGTPVIRIPNIGNMEVTLNDIKFLKDAEEKHTVDLGDILIVRSNGSRDLVGKTAIINRKSASMAFASYLIRIRPVKVIPEFILLLLNTEIIKRQFFSKSKSSAGINNINTEELASTIIPLPSIEEQLEIIKVVNKLLEVEKESIRNLDLSSKIDSLKSSILNKAFRGELGTNDPTEENAIRLLKEVLQEQAI